MKVGDYIRGKIRSFLRIEPADRQVFSVKEGLDRAGTAYMHRLWYRGKADELAQFYAELPDTGCKFWHCSSTRGMEMRRLHTGLPKIIIKTLTQIVTGDFNGIQLDESYQQLWDDIARDNRFPRLLVTAVRDMLIVGDGAFKVSIDPFVSELPIIEWFGGERVEFVHRRGRLHEVIFLTEYAHKGGMSFILHEHYGRGHIRYRLFRSDGTEFPLSYLPQTEQLSDVEYAGGFIMAVPLMRSEDGCEKRGESIFEGKEDNFDALDESWSQWMQAQRVSRPMTYIPDRLIPRDPKNGALIKRNAFDNQFVEIASNMAEGAQDRVTVEQPKFPAAEYNATFITALDLALQGVISPSTLGIDVKKLDNAEAQREKEKTTLYTRAALIEALSEALPELVKTALNVHFTSKEQAVEKISAAVKFGEYANPSFEAVVETMSNPNTPMSIEAKVEELWGDSRDEKWKAAEVMRIKAQAGIAEVAEPSLAE